MRVILVDAGYEVVISHGALPDGPFDCVLTDLVGVGMYRSEDARDWLLRLADRYPAAPTIVVTAHPEARHDGTLAGRQVIIKPFDVDVITNAVRQTLPK